MPAAGCSRAAHQYCGIAEMQQPAHVSVKPRVNCMGRSSLARKYRHRLDRCHPETRGSRVVTYFLLNYVPLIMLHPMRLPLNSAPSCTKMQKPTARHLILRSEEKSRTRREGSSSASFIALLSSALFFDISPQEILDNVLRFLSLLPRAVN